MNRHQRNGILIAHVELDEAARLVRTATDRATGVRLEKEDHEALVDSLVTVRNEIDSFLFGERRRSPKLVVNNGGRQ